MKTARTCWAVLAAAALGTLPAAIRGRTDQFLFLFRKS